MMWMARVYPAEAPNTCIISNGFASMGIAVPGAIAAKLAYPERKAVAVTGDAGFLMNSQEIETGLRLGLGLVVLIWRDDKYGLIEWHQNRKFGRPSHIDFTNPDFVKYAESFGAKGYRVEAAGELVPVLQRALADDTVVIIDCPGINAVSASRIAFTQHEPIGVVLPFSAFNHPTNLVVHQVCPAVAAGAPFIVKPASS